MAENWCKEHKQVWFKSGNMKGYAHPIVDEAGNPTGEWCNKPKGEAKPEPSYKADPEKTASIVKQVAMKGAIELSVASKIDVDKILSYAEVFARWMGGDITVKDEEVFRALLKKTFNVED